jgi:hypothetical protein
MIGSGLVAWSSLGYLAMRCLISFTPGFMH